MHCGGDSAASVHDEGPAEISVSVVGAGKPICAAGGVDGVGGGIGVGGGVGGCCGGISSVGGRGGGGDGGQS